MWVFLNHLQSTKFSTDGFQKRCRNIYGDKDGTQPPEHWNADVYAFYVLHFAF